MQDRGEANTAVQIPMVKIIMQILIRVLFIVFLSAKFVKVRRPSMVAIVKNGSVNAVY